MDKLLLFLGFSFLAMFSLILVNYYNKKADFKSLSGLFLFGILISIPFVLVEYLGHHLRYYMMILAFISLEICVLLIERNVKYFHDLIHHNIKELRIASFFLIGIGFTYSEISFTIFNYHGNFNEILNILPFKTLYALLMHTIFASAASLIHLGNLFAETLYETIFKLFGYYLRISIIGTSHFLYTFTMEHHLLNIIIILAGVGIPAFFILKYRVDARVKISQ